MTNYHEIGKHIADTIHKVGGKALTHNQHMAMVGAISVWMEKAALAERERCAMVCEDMDDKHMSEAIRRGK